jgi:hypothetical protein
MEQQTGIAALDLFATSRTGIDVASDQIIEAVRSGEVNPLKVRVWIKTMEEILERVKKETADSQLREAEKYAEKSFQFAGATLTKSEHGTKYNYAVCGDTTWERLDVDAKTAISKRSMREEFLKSLKEPLTIVDEMTGEVVKINPPVKTSTTGLNVSIK